MDCHGWRVVYAMIRSVDRAIPRTGRKKRYSDVLIVAMFLWAVEHDRPLCWACRRSSYASGFRPRRLPSVSQFSRRIRSPRCQWMLETVEERLGVVDLATPISMVDGRPLVVGACSKDRDARPGRVYGGFARGYKLHALVSQDARVRAWEVTSLNVSEKRVAMRLVPKVTLGDWLLGDGNYDKGSLYDLVAEQGCQLLTPLPRNAGRGHRRKSPARLRAAELWCSGVARPIHRQRGGVERCFGNQSSFGGGLAPLPAWVRTLPRVRNWVVGKLIIYHARLQIRRAAG